MQTPLRSFGKNKLTFDHDSLTVYYRKYHLIRKWKKKLSEDPSFFWDIDWDHIQIKRHFRKFVDVGYKAIFDHNGKERLLMFNKPYKMDLTKLNLKGKHIDRVIKRLCGEKIGSGLHRDVYLLKANDRYVVKVERKPSEGMFSNVTEYRYYVQNTEWKFLSDWLAPCVAINETGQVMIQERVNWEGKKKKDYPKKIPAMFTDLKFKNFGWIGDRFVCCDYSFMCFETGMKHAGWWGEF